MPKVKLLVTGVLFAALVPLAACTDSGSGDNKAQPTVNSTVPGSGGPTGGPGGTASPGGETGTTDDKASCDAIRVKLTAWGGSFAEAISGLSAAGNDAKKIEVVVNKVKAANTQFAKELRDLVASAKDAQLKKVATDLAAALEKVNSQLTTQKVVANPDALTTMYELPEYATSAENYEKLCGAT